MDEIEISICIILVAVGAYSVGRLAEAKNALFWKVEWIKLEHRLAKVEGREPRDCNKIY